MRVVFFVGSVEMEGVVSVMYRAMECRLEEVFEKLDDIGWIEKLCMELRDRINGLTPSRLDLEESFKREFDVELLVQMLRHEAVDSEELKKILESVWVRLSMLCAPVHDDEISGLLLESRSGNCSIAKMLCAANRIPYESPTSVHYELHDQHHTKFQRDPRYLNENQDSNNHVPVCKS